MSNKPLAYRLGLYISFAVLAVFIVFILWVLNFHFARTKKSEEAKAIQLSAEVQRNIRDRVLLTQLIAVNVARQVHFYHENKGIEPWLRDLMDEFGFLQSLEIKLNHLEGKPEDSVFIVAHSGNEIIFGKDDKSLDFCIDEDTLMRYFGDLSKTGWSEPFKCVKKSTNILVFNHYFERTDTSDSIVTSGSVKCELLLDSLQELTNNTKIYINGYVFLVSHNGSLMTYPVKEFVLKKTIWDLVSEGALRDTFRFTKFLRGESGPITVFSPALGKAKCWSYASVIHETGWTLITTVPYSELYQNLFSFLIKASLMMFLVVSTIFLSVFYITKRILRPLSNISRELHHFSIEIPEHRINTGNETVALKQSLAQLQERYEKYRKREEESATKGLKFLSDLALASEIQQSIIPPPGNYSFCEGRIHIHSVYKPAQFISGDLYDFFLIGNNRFLVTIGDVSGGGIPAALFMGIAHTYIRSNFSFRYVKDIVNQVNRQICKNNSSQFFLTLFLGIIDVQKETINYCNAGHTPTFLLNNSGHVRELGDQHGLPLGLYPDRNYQDSTVSLRKGDSLILYTDGITEEVNPEGEFFGVDSFYKLFNQIKQMSPEESARLIIQNVESFRNETGKKDDLSLVVIKMN